MLIVYYAHFDPITVGVTFHSIMKTSASPAGHKIYQPLTLWSHPFGGNPICLHTLSERPSQACNRFTHSGIISFTVSLFG